MMTRQKRYAVVKRRVGSLELEVCRRDDQYGAGPCFSVYKHGREILRFDLFPVGAHWHVYSEVNQPRHYFAKDGTSFVPVAPDIESGARRAAAPPWDVMVQAAHAEAARRFPQLASDDARAWLLAELAQRNAEPAGR